MLLVIGLTVIRKRGTLLGLDQFRVFFRLTGFLGRSFGKFPSEDRVLAIPQDDEQDTSMDQASDLNGKSDFKC
jgi:hypothetical protein